MGGDRSDALEVLFTLEKEIGKVVEPMLLSANTFLEAVLPDAPVVRQAETTLLETLQGNWVRWEVFDTPTLQWVDASDASSAQKRWTSLALLHAAADGGRGRVLIIDEPERALHRGAIAQMAANLPRIAAESDTPIVIASHAPEFISSETARVFHVSRGRGDGRATVEELTAVGISEISEAADLLGLTPTDLLQMTRTFVLVEGAHDEIVIGSVLSDVLIRAQALILPIRGAKALTTLLDSAILLPFTTARLLIVLDHISDPEALESAWAQSVDIAKSDSSRAVREFAASIARIQNRSHPTAEDQSATSLAFSLLRSEYAHRVDLFGFKRVGIEKYLPIERFTDASVTWDTLNRDYMGQSLSSRRNESEKDWLRRVHDISVDIDTVTQAAADLDSDQISQEFTRLADVIRSSGRPDTGQLGSDPSSR